MDRAKRALPMWTKKKPTEKVHIVDVKPKVIKGKNKPPSVKRPKPWQPDDVLILKKK